QDVMPRRWKASRQGDRSQDRQRRFKWHGGERSWSTGTGQNCYRDGYWYKDGCYRTRDRGVSRLRFCKFPSARYERSRFEHDDGCMREVSRARLGGDTGRVTVAVPSSGEMRVNSN
ncbi:hypothetical protein A2U01_0063135, partial [Trifolium medium]|nr:hypothetical protein [Trifolium medium]